MDVVRTSAPEAYDEDASASRQASYNFRRSFGNEVEVLCYQGTRGTVAVQVCFRVCHRTPTDTAESQITRVEFRSLEKRYKS
jgi:hypothetical protein